MDAMATPLANVLKAPGDTLSFTHLCVGVSQLDGNVSLQLILETDSLNTRDGLYYCRLSVCYVSNGTNVNLKGKPEGQ